MLNKHTHINCFVSHGYQCITTFNHSGSSRVITIDDCLLLLFSCYSSTVSAEPFLNGSSGTYIEQMYEHWQKDPTSVHASWDSYFRNVDSGLGPGAAFQRPGMTRPSVTVGGVTVDIKMIQDHLKVQALIRAYQVLADPSASNWILVFFIQWNLSNQDSLK